jgi:hypothetical protein
MGAVRRRGKNIMSDNIQEELDLLSSTPTSDAIVAVKRSMRASRMMTQDIISNGILPLPRLIQYRDILGVQTLLLKLVTNGMKSNMPDIYRSYIFDTMSPTSVTLLRSAGYIWTSNELNKFLSNERWILKFPIPYDTALLQIFKDNSIMYNKWKRYANNIRNS